MKTLILNFFFVLVSFSLSAQYAFSDAVFLKETGKKAGEDFNFGSTQREEVAGVLLHYFPDYKNSFSNLTDMGEALQENPFFRGHVFVTGTEQGDEKLVPAGLSKATLAVGGMDVTNFALGLSDFLMERTKTELNNVFFVRFREQLNREEMKDLKILFPATVAVLNLIGDEIYQYDLYLTGLRVAFEKDLNALLKNIPAVVENHKSEEFFVKNKALYQEILLSLNLAEWVDQGRHPGEILKLLAANEYWQKLVELKSDTLNNLDASLQMLALLSESLREANSDAYWVNPAGLIKLRDETTLRIYLGLIYQQCKNQPECAGVKFNRKPLLEILSEIGDGWDKGKQNMEQIRNFVTQLAAATEKVGYRVLQLKNVQHGFSAQQNLSGRDRNKLIFDASIDTYIAGLELMECAFNMAEFPGLGSVQIPADVQFAFQSMEEAGQIGIFISCKRYSGAVSQTALLLGKFLRDEKSKACLSQFLKYGSFMAALVEAETAEQAKGAIAAIALPPGSYSIKRHARFNVSLNGYLGGFYGQENIDGVKNIERFNNVSLSAPVGIYVGWGNRKPFHAKNPWSFGFSIPVIDLGTVASYRFGNDSLQSVPEIKLEHIFAPGIFAEIGIGGTPLSFGFGTQMGPRLRSVGLKVNQVGDMYWRYGFTLKVDIPILNFYASPKRK